jgi:hypothetical protein
MTKVTKVSKKVGINNLNDEEIENLFTDAYADQVGSRINVPEFDCKCAREVGDKNVKVEITVIGLAGTPTLDDYKNVKFKESTTVVISRDDIGSIKFKLIPSATVSLNTNDYVVTYQAV